MALRERNIPGTEIWTCVRRSDGINQQRWLLLGCSQTYTQNLSSYRLPMVVGLSPSIRGIHHQRTRQPGYHMEAANGWADGLEVRRRRKSGMLDWRLSDSVPGPRAVRARLGWWHECVPIVISRELKCKFQVPVQSTSNLTAASKVALPAVAWNSSRARLGLACTMHLRLGESRFFSLRSRRLCCKAFSAIEWMYSQSTSSKPEP